MNSNDKYSKNELIIIYLISSFIGINPWQIYIINAQFQLRGIKKKNT